LRCSNGGGAVYYLIAGVLVGNVWKAWRRVHARWRKIRPFPETSHVIVSREIAELSSALQRRVGGEPERTAASW
jgi:hypothetical protein